MIYLDSNMATYVSQYQKTLTFPFVFTNLKLGILNKINIQFTAATVIVKRIQSSFDRFLSDGLYLNLLSSAREIKFDCVFQYY